MLLPGVTVISATQDGAMMTDLALQIRRIPDAVTRIVVSIGGNDSIRASGVIDETASSVSAALERWTDQGSISSELCEHGWDPVGSTGSLGLLQRI
jgi:hypothetical protein